MISVSVFIPDIYLFFLTLYYFYVWGFWPHLCQCEAGLLCEYWLSSIRFNLV